MYYLSESAFFAVAMVALARLDHRVKFYLWKACNEAKVHPDDLLKTRRLNRTTYAGLLDLTRRETLEIPPQELPPIQGELIDYARARTVRTPTRQLIKYFKEVVLHAEHRLFGDQANFRELQLDARFVAVYTFLIASAVFFASRHPLTVERKSYPGRTMIAISKQIILEQSVVRGCPGRWHVGTCWPYSTSSNQEIINSKGLPESCDCQDHDFFDSYLFSDNNVWPVDVEGDDHTWDDSNTNEYESRDRCTEYNPLPIFGEVLNVPLLLVAHYMRKQLAAVLGKKRLGIMEHSIMRAVGSWERKFQYQVLKEAFPVLPTPAEARQVIMSPVQLTLTETMADMPLVVGRALFTIGIDEVFQGDKRMQDAAEAAAKVNAVSYLTENLFGSAIACSEEGKIQITNEETKHMLQLLKEMRYEDKLPSTDIHVFDFAMGLLQVDN